MLRPSLASTLAATAVLLSACGGGGGGSSTEPPATTTKQLSGVVGGSTGALTLAGNPISISGPVTINGQTATAADVRPGSVISSITTVAAAKAASALSLSEVDIARELRGPVEAVDGVAGTITVVGQTATVDALTEIENENPDDSRSSITLADIAVGDYVDISGVRGAAGSLIATRIEREQIDSGDAGYNQVEFRGVVSALDTVARAFSIGDDRVDYSTATVQGSIADGVQVEVHGRRAASTITATRVEVHQEMEGERGHGAEFEGIVSELNTTARTFGLFDFTVDYSAITPLPDLINGARVELAGTIDQTNAQLLHATALRIEHRDGGHGTADDESKGQVTAVDSGNGTLTAGGSDYWTDAQSIVERDDQEVAFSQIAVGSLVEVKSDSTRVQGSARYATKIEIRGSAPPGGPTSGLVEIEGRITAFDMTAHSLSVDGQAVSTNDGTRYQIDDASVTASAFFASDRTEQHVEVKGTASASGVLAAKIEIRLRD